MPTHARSSLHSQVLCDLLLSKVAQELNGVTRNQAEGSCSIGITTRFAYVYHRRDSLQVYLRGKEADGSRLTALRGSNSSVTLSRRKAMGSPWAQITPYYLEFDSELGVQQAVPLILHAAGQIQSRKSARAYQSPSEAGDAEMVEGKRITIQVSRVERDPRARRQCIRLFGTACSVCGFSFATVYGEICNEFIHVHHLNPLAASDGQRNVNAETDLRPVCPNCHEMLHKRTPPFTIEELKAKISSTNALLNNTSG